MLLDGGGVCCSSKIFSLFFSPTAISKSGVGEVIFIMALSSLVFFMLVEEKDTETAAVGNNDD